MSCSKTKHGKVYIFNVIEMKGVPNSERRGSRKDVDNLKETFEHMNADVVEPFLDFTENDLKIKMQEIKNEDFTDYDYVVIVFCSHGDENSIASTSLNEYIYIQRTLLVPLFKNVTLSKKLKWLITQTCRGSYEVTTEAAEVIEHSICSITSAVPEVSFNDPRYYLISYSTTEGFVSKRCTINGSFFIQSLCEELLAHYRDKDIFFILNRVSESVRTKGLRADGKEQRPANEDNFGTKFKFSFFNESAEK